MFDKLSFILCFIIILTCNFYFFSFAKVKEEQVLVSQKPTVVNITLKKVTLKQKEIKKVELIPIEPPRKEEFVQETQAKKVLVQAKKIVKKAKRVVQKKTEKKVLKKEPVKSKKVVKKITSKIKKETKIVKNHVTKKPIEKLKKVEKKVLQKEQAKLTPSVRKKIVSKPTEKNIVSDSTKEHLTNEYLSKIKSHIEKYKKYPKRAKRLKQQGQVIVGFEIAPNGQISSVSLKSKSPYKRLNLAALKILKEIIRFDPIPKELNKTTWAIEVPISYSISKS